MGKSEMGYVSRAAPKMLLVGKYIHDVAYMYVRTTTANLQKIREKSVNLQALCSVHAARVRELAQRSRPSYAVTCPLFMASSITGQNLPLPPNIYLP